MQIFHHDIVVATRVWHLTGRSTNVEHYPPHKIAHNLRSVSWCRTQAEQIGPGLAQARDGKLGHLEFLQVLCEDEIARRDTAALARRVRRARFEQHSTFEDFDFTVSPRLPAAVATSAS